MPNGSYCPRHADCSTELPGSSGPCPERRVRWLTRDPRSRGDGSGIGRSSAKVGPDHETPHWRDADDSTGEGPRCCRRRRRKVAEATGIGTPAPGGTEPCTTSCRTRRRSDQRSEPLVKPRVSRLRVNFPGGLILGLRAHRPGGSDPLQSGRGAGCQAAISSNDGFSYSARTALADWCQ